MMKRVLSFVLVAAMVLGMFAVVPVQAQAASEMKVSDALLNYVKSIEGFHAIPYWDHAQWTVGFGSHCPSDKLELYKKEGIPIADANALLASSLNGYGDKVKEFAKKNNITLTQAKFDALVSFTYNLGTGWMTATNGTMRNAVVNGYTGNEFLAAISVYCNASGQYYAGLMVRRLTEANMYLNGVYGRYAPGNYAYVRYDGNGGTVTASAQGYDCNLYAVPASTASYSGYAFQGWYTAKEGGIRITELDETTDGMILYAHWVKDSEGGTVLPDGGVKVTVTGSRVNVRKGPGLNYATVGSVTKGTELTITKIKEANGYLWGKCSNGWLALAYTTYEEKSQGSGDTGTSTPPSEDDPDSNMPNLPANATVVSSSIVVRNGPHATYPQIATLTNGQVITILEIVDVLGTQWGRFDGGWVSVDGGGLELDNYPALAHSFEALVKYSSLNVRCGPGTSYTKVGTVPRNTKLVITSLMDVNGQIWGKHSLGWSRLDYNYTDFDSSKIEQYKNHSFGAWYDSKEASCAAKGEQRRDCKLCAHFEMQETVYAEHKYGQWAVSEPGTCVTPGKEARACSVCGDVQTRNGSLGTHVCGEWVTEIPATCISEGKQRRTCQYCDYFETQKTALGDHQFGDWVVAQEPTENAPGVERRDCVLCDHYELRQLVAEEHVYSEWVIIKASTCTEKGEARRYCTHCDKVESREIAETGHAFGEWTQTKAPSCKEVGEDTRKCANCTHSEKREVSKLEHTATSWQPVTAPTCSAEGTEAGRCTACGEMVTRPVATTDHSYGEWTLYKASTCAVAGEERRTCASCDKFESRQLALAEHSFGQWQQTKAPTTSEEGEERRDCQICDHFETRAVARIEEYYVTVTSDALAIRTGPGTSYARTGLLYSGTRVLILEDKTVGNVVWGRMEKGWICLTGYVAVEESSGSTPDVEVPAGKVYATVTCDALTIRKAPGTNYARVGLMYRGTRVEILEQREVSGKVWGRTEKGWICLTGYTTLETVMEQAATFAMVSEQTTVKTYATVTCSALMVREGAGTDYTLVGKLSKGDEVEILDQIMVGSAAWGQTESGWICLTGYTSLETKTEEN